MWRSFTMCDAHFPLCDIHSFHAWIPPNCRVTVTVFLRDIHTSLMWRLPFNFSGWRSVFTVVFLYPALAWLVVRHWENPGRTDSISRRRQAAWRADWRAEGKTGVERNSRPSCFTKRWLVNGDAHCLFESVRHLPPAAINLYFVLVIRIKDLIMSE